jgi:SNF2 family DNA or RNA helicase
LLPAPEVQLVDLVLPVDLAVGPHWDRPVEVVVRNARLLAQPPWTRPLGKLDLEVTTEGWKFPVPPLRDQLPASNPARRPPPFSPPRLARKPGTTRIQPPSDTVVFKERLLYLLQPSLETVFSGRQVPLPFAPYPYQLEGIAFLMPRHSALLADEMGLGKTIQTILALRLLFHAGLIHRALIVCPKALVPNWARELRLWAEELPFEAITGDTRARRTGWVISNCPLKLVNYELLTRDTGLIADEQVRFDVVVLDEAQRIKNRDSKTSQAVRSLQRRRSWALTGTPVENRPEDLINIFAFIDPDRVPADTPARRLPHLTGDCILRRTTDQVMADLPPKIVRDAYLELTPAQRESYVLAEKEGVIRLNELGATITVQHVFELVLRLKQICNFDPLTGQSAKLDQLQADLAEVADSGRKAIVFSQWVEPLEVLAKELAGLGPLLYHGRVPQWQRQVILEQFRTDRRKHVLLMSYGTGSVGLNLQAANYVFLFDRWWNPATEDQAIKRAHRIGQKETVFVTRFTTQDTIEGRIAAILEKKRQLFSELLEQSDPPPTLGLTEEEIFGLFDIKPRPPLRKAA